MRIAVETTGRTVDTTGVARYIEQLLPALRERPGLEVLEMSMPRRGPQTPVVQGILREAWWFPVRVQTGARRLRADVLHCTGPLAPARRSGIPTVVTVNDAMAVRHPEWFTRSNVEHTRHVLPRSLRAADRILAPSRHAAADICDAFGLRPSKVRVVPYGVDGRFGPGTPDRNALRRHGVGDRPYVMSVGKLQPRKNLEAALEAFAKVSRDRDLDLLIVGARGWRDRELMQRLRATGIDRRVRLAGHVSDDELVELYRGALCLLFPSRYEGFGFPPLESMACGTPVVCADRTSLPELVGRAGILVDPDDAPAMADAIRSLVDNPTHRAELGRLGTERAATFQWKRCATETELVYRELTS